MLVCMHEENIFKIFAVVAHLDACIYYLICKTDLTVAGPHWRFGTFSFLLYSQRFIKGQVEVARQKKSDMFVVLF